MLASYLKSLSVTGSLLWFLVLVFVKCTVVLCQQHSPTPVTGMYAHHLECSRHIMALPSLPQCSDVDWARTKRICVMDDGYDACAAGSSTFCAGLSRYCAPTPCRSGSKRTVCWPEKLSVTGGWRCACGSGPAPVSPLSAISVQNLYVEHGDYALRHMFTESLDGNNAEQVSCAFEWLPPSAMPPQPVMSMDSSNGIRTRSPPGPQEFCPEGEFANAYQPKVSVS